MDNIMPDPFQSSKFSAEHANRHIKNFDIELRSFLQSDPYTRVIEVDTKDIATHKVKLNNPFR